MRRYAAHYLFLPAHGFLKQFVVEIDEAQRVSRLFPLMEEVEDTEWLPGVIALLPAEEGGCPQFDKCRRLLSAVPPSIEKELPSLVPWLFSPFDFTRMQPGAGTQRKRLR